MGYVDNLMAPGEAVIHRTRRHWIVLVRWIGSALLLALLGAIMAALFAANVPGPSGVGVWVGVGLVAIALLVSLPAWLRWRSEVYLVTVRRVIRVSGVLHKQALDSGLGKVNDVRLTQTLAGRLLGYGTLEIITASESSINRLEYLPQPLVFKKAMMGATGSEGHREPASAPAGPATASGLPAGAAGIAAPPPASQPPRAADRLDELEELRRRGLLSDEEYRSKRDEIVRAL